MKMQAFNPYLPSYEYVPDGEPHVFGNKVYVFGSHDAFGANAFCVNDYVCWSAPVDNLGNWRCEGVIYRKNQDPLNTKGTSFMNAPDVCKGSDGRFYLYYQLHIEAVTSVAVSDDPAGPYDFYGHVKHPDGILYGKKKTDAYNFDPSVLLDEDGKVYLYTGFSPDKGFMRNVLKLRGGTYDGGTVAELEIDMLTLKGQPEPTIPGPILAKGTLFDGHGFYEAGSIRKIGNIYYLVYSSILSHELCYATSQHPKGPWSYGGTIVSIGDVGLLGITDKNARNFLGNTHGGMVCLNGQWYIFYHRQTNQQKCCRQGCAEPISVEVDGSIRQVEVTSCGLNGVPLSGCGTYEARIACNLWSQNGTFAYTKTRHTEQGYPYFTQTGEDRESAPDQYIANLCDGSCAGFKYFDFDGENRMTVSLRAGGTGRFVVSTSAQGEAIAVFEVKEAADWAEYMCEMTPLYGVKPLYFTWHGNDSVDFRSFLSKKKQLQHDAEKLSVVPSMQSGQKRHSKEPLFICFLVRVARIVT